LGDAYLLSAQYDQAIRAYDIVLRREPRNQMAMLGLASARVQNGQLQEALQLYDQAITLNPQLAGVILDDCLYYVSQGKIWTAKRVFGVMNARIPNNEGFYVQYANRLKAAGPTSAAYKNYQLLRGLP
jgi:tetratricopeptide (TPR) repeat protein